MVVMVDTDIWILNMVMMNVAIGVDGWVFAVDGVGDGWHDEVAETVVQGKVGIG
ncbi:uncharacterized protein M6B38_390215 [Iris pallida]|uniref:Uncharacterized protein n=1 Tax=Iris pallida TaxID=29817 RepID=A0AAX6G170_IRIPA|nr:uncharacterized protein M6B38_390215 [Iris pallida]